VLSGRVLCDELITRPEKSYRLCCVVVCDLETSRIGAPYISDISSLRVNTSFKYSGKIQNTGLRLDRSPNNHLSHDGTKITSSLVFMFK
jgi:hypothetical protein